MARLLEKEQIKCTVVNGLGRRCNREATVKVSSDFTNKSDYMCNRCLDGFKKSFFKGCFCGVKLVEIKDIKSKSIILTEDFNS
jgi:hypothetical protein